MEKLYNRFGNLNLSVIIIMKNYSQICLKLTEFLASYLEKSGAKGFVLGVSGGIDSAVVAALCKRTGFDTYALLMPAKHSSERNLSDALKLCSDLKIMHKIIEIQPILDSFVAQIGEPLPNLRMGNLSARARMCLLYDYSARVNALVVGTSNKSERMLGYGTIYGDMACALNPIGELFKTEIYELARELGIDEKIIAKAPSADLWEEQSDEADIGYSYERLDEILRLAQSKSEDELARKFDPKLVATVFSRMRANKFKLAQPPVASLE